jgi:transposase
MLPPKSRYEPPQHTCAPPAPAIGRWEGLGGLACDCIRKAAGKAYQESRLILAPRAGTVRRLPFLYSQGDYDKAAYKQRNVIERIFCRLEDWRRIATRFDRNIRAFMGAIALAATVIWWL